jgi:hypothetical protein
MEAAGHLARSTLVQACFSLSTMQRQCCGSQRCKTLTDFAMIHVQFQSLTLSYRASVLLLFLNNT